MKPFKMRKKKIKEKDLTWHMVGEIVKNRVGQSCIFHVIIPAHHPAQHTVKILLVKFMYCTAKHKPKM